MEPENAVFPLADTMAAVTAMRLARAHSEELLTARVGWASDAQKKPETVTFLSLTRPWMRVSHMAITSCHRLCRNPKF
jgi:hypothetical protein